MATTSAVRNIVLVHGAFADGSGWQPVYQRLVDRGFLVTVVQEPETGLADDVAATLRAIETVDGPLVLVGHSWGGQVITEAGAHPRVAALIYVAALVPDVGESTNSLHARIPAASTAVIAGADGFLRIDPEQFGADFAADLPTRDADFMAHAQVPIRAEALDAPAAAAAWRDRPSYGIVAGADRTINPDLERWMYERAGAEITEVPGSSHVVMLSHPDVVADVIERAVTAAASAVV